MTLDKATSAVLERLKRGPANTVELQAMGMIVHAPRQIYQLRQDGWVITTTRLPNRVALYKLVGRIPDAPVDAGNPVRVTSSRPETAPASSRVPRVPVFGDVASGRPR